MQIHVRPPPPALRPFVEHIWYFASSGMPHARERKLPNGSMQLLLNLYEDELRTYAEDSATVHRIGGAALSGTYSEPFVIDTAEQRSIAGVSFRPGGAYPFFRPPADELGAAHVELDVLWGRDGAVLRERLLEARTPDAILRTLERELLARAVRPLQPDRAVDWAIRALDRGASVRAVMSRMGMSSRRFIRGFAERVGLTPKRFGRLRRFWHVVESIEVGRSDWAQLALACGYYDQAHLINEFREFAGITPTAYAPRPSGDRSHVPLPD